MKIMRKIDTEMIERVRGKIVEENVKWRESKKNKESMRGQWNETER